MITRRRMRILSLRSRHASGPLTEECLGKPSPNIRARIEKAQEIQQQRFAGSMGGANGNVPLLCNADMGPAQIRQHCPLDDAGKSLPFGPAICWAGLRAVMTQPGMSARAFHRTA
jgi:magnesium chelatase family protein